MAFIFPVNTVPTTNHPEPRAMYAVNVHKSAVPMVSLTSWIKAGSQCGINTLAVFETTGVQIDLENVHRHRVKPTDLFQALYRCTKACKSRHFPLVLGDTLSFDQIPAADTFLATSPTLRDAFQLVNWATHFMGPWLNVKLEENDDEAWVSLELPFLRSETAPLRFITEAAMASIKKIGLELIGPHMSIRAVHFRHDRPQYHEEYARHFSVEPRYNQTKNAIFFDRAFLDEALPGSMPRLHAQALELLSSHVHKMQAPQSFSQEVIEKMIHHPAIAAEGLEAVATSFGMSGRTLQRRLNREGQSFSDVLARARQTLGTRWLAETDMDIQTIGQRLGYQSRRAFTSAFKHWTGLSPSHYRERQKI
jgi:AraC-like DNA-binding protein